MDHEHSVLTGSVIEAGQRALLMARDQVTVQTKADRSPVTSIDLEVNRLLETAIRTAFPNDGWLSEESPDTAARLSAARVWVIDPIDGTKALIARRPSFVISAALVEAGEPVLACIYNPSTGELFTARKGGGAQLNGHPIQANAPATSPFPLLVNTSESESGRFRVLGDSVSLRALGSIAYSLALVAAGMAPAMLTFERENEWDVAAAALLIQEAGGTITDGSGRPFRFNQPTPTYQGTIAVSPVAKPAFEALLARLRATPTPTPG